MVPCGTFQVLGSKPSTPVQPHFFPGDEWGPLGTSISRGSQLPLAGARAQEALGTAAWAWTPEQVAAGMESVGDRPWQWPLRPVLGAPRWTQSFLVDWRPGAYVAMG